MKIALVGATGLVGEQIIEQLVKRSFPYKELRLFASPASEGEFLDVSAEPVPVSCLTEKSFDGMDLVLFAAPAAVSRDWCRKAADAGAICLDLSDDARLAPDRPLLVAGVNDAQFAGSIVSTPASLTIQLSRLLSGLSGLPTLRSLLVTAILPASEKGRAGIAELQKQSGELLNGRSAPGQIFPGQLAFNCLPSSAGGLSDPLAAELLKVLNQESFPVRINRLQLPLFYGEGAFVRLEFAEVLTTAQLRKALASTEGLELQEAGALNAPLDAIGEESLLLHLCSSSSAPTACFDLWFAADNIGSVATNGVRLAENLKKTAGSV